MRWGLFHDKEEENPTVVETVRPVEIPVITTVKQCLSRGDYREAVRYAYQATIYDIQRATNIVFPPNWTNRDVIERTQLGRRGYMPQLLTQLYALYEPVRYGGPKSVNGAKGDIVGILQSIYSEEALWRLYTRRIEGSRTPTGEPNEQVYRIRGSRLYVRSTPGDNPSVPGQIRLEQSSLYIARKKAAEARQN